MGDFALRAMGSPRRVSNRVVRWSNSYFEDPSDHSMDTQLEAGKSVAENRVGGCSVVQEAEVEVGVGWGLGKWKEVDRCKRNVQKRIDRTR